MLLRRLYLYLCFVILMVALLVDFLLVSLVPLFLDSNTTVQCWRIGHNHEGDSNGKAEQEIQRLISSDRGACFLLFFLFLVFVSYSTTLNIKTHYGYRELQRKPC